MDLAENIVSVGVPTAVGEHLVGIAVHWAAPGTIGTFGRVVFGGHIASALVGRGIEIGGFGMVWGAGFIAVTARVAERNPALRALQQAAEALHLLVLSEIAFYDQGELIWRTVHPPGAAGFERFLTKQICRAATEELAAETAAFAAAASPDSPMGSGPVKE